MSNKNINQFAQLVDTNTGDFLLLWDSSNSLTYKVAVNDVIRLDSAAITDEWFNNIYVRNYGRISGIIGGNTGTNLISGNWAGILAGTSNTCSGVSSSIAGGQSNWVVVNNSFIGGGDTNKILNAATYGIIGGGLSNSIIGNTSAIVGGDSNKVTGNYSIACAGFSNKVSGDYSFGGGGLRNVSSGIYSVIVGGSDNVSYTERTFVGAGNANRVSGNSSAILAGTSNIVDGNVSIIAGGQSNFIAPTNAFIGAGDTNQIRLAGSYGFVGAGLNNTIIGNTSVIGGGDTNRATGDYTFIGGGLNNNASGHYSAVPGGTKNSARRNFSFAAGRNSVADHDGSWVVSDARGEDKYSAGQNTLLADFSGGAWFTGGGLNARRGFNLYPTGAAPTTSTPGRSGDFAVKDNYLYVYTGDPNDTNRSWGRVALSTLDGSPPSIVSNDHQITYGGTGYNAVVAKNYFEVSATGGGVRFAGPGNIGPTTLSITLPAGQGTYVIDCIMGVRKGSYATSMNYMLYNTTDSRIVPNASGDMLLAGSDEDDQWTIKIITGIHSSEQATSKVIQLYCHRFPTVSEDDSLFIVSTGTMISYIKLR